MAASARIALAGNGIRNGSRCLAQGNPPALALLLCLYELSFTVIGIYGPNHHYLFKLFAKTDRGLNLVNLLLLMIISFLPFPTHVLGTHWAEEANRPVAATFYAVGLLLPAVAWLMIWLHACHCRKLVRPQLDQGFLRKLTLQFLGTVVVYALAVAISVVDYM